MQQSTGYVQVGNVASLFQSWCVSSEWTISIIGVFQCPLTISTQNQYIYSLLMRNKCTEYEGKKGVQRL